MQVTNDGELREWLDSVKDWRVQAAFATRCALRVVPMAMAGVDITDGEYRGVDLTLATLRASLISGVAGNRPTPEMSDDLKARALSAARSAAHFAARSAARSAAHSAAHFAARSAAHFAADSAAHSAARSADSAAHFAARSAARSADSAAHFAARSADSAVHSAARSADSAAHSAARSAARSAAYFDAEYLQNSQPDQLFQEHLWQTLDHVQHLAEMMQAFNNRPDPDGHWRFWKRWYRGMFDGNPMPWELQRRIALEIQDQVWKSGPGQVAGAIQAIETDYLKSKTVTKDDPSFSGEEQARFPAKQAKLILARTDLVPNLVEHKDTQSLHLDKTPPHNQDPIEFARTSIQGALSHALNVNLPNGLREDSDETLHLRQAFSNLPQEACYLAPVFHHVFSGLDRKIQYGEYPEEASLIFLINQCKAHCHLMCEAEPEIAKFIESYEKLPEPSPLDQKTVDDLRAAPETFSDLLGEDAKSALKAEAEIVQSGQTPSKLTLAKLNHWWTQVGMYLDRIKKDDARIEWLVKFLRKLWDSGGFGDV